MSFIGLETFETLCQKWTLGRKRTGNIFSGKVPVYFQHTQGAVADSQVGLSKNHTENDRFVCINKALLEKDSVKPQRWLTR